MSALYISITKQMAKEQVNKTEQYERHKQQAAARMAAISAQGRDIPGLPPVDNPERRNNCERDFRLFCETYFGECFRLNWSQDHLTILETIQKTILEGGLYVLACPRGTGKSTITMAACIWAVLYNHRRFVVLIASNAERAKSHLANIKVWLETNPLLLLDFPEVCVPVAKLERIAVRAIAQTYRGQPTRLVWAADRISLPVIAGTPAQGAIISTAGMKAADIRGQNATLPDGTVIRPDIVILDDPQDFVSAHSQSQCRQRLSLINGDVLGLAGPGQKIAAVIPATVIAPNDLVDRLLNRETNPHWQGTRMQMLRAFPKNTKLWEEYANIRAEGLKAGLGLKPATEFYREHQTEMDEGANASWKDRFNDDEISAIQHAMNLFYQCQQSFASEYQNQPLQQEQHSETLTADEIEARVNGFKRLEIPQQVEHITAGIDCQQDCLYYVLVGWTSNFSGYVLDYGTWPDQKLRYFNYHSLTYKLANKYKDGGDESKLQRGLSDLLDRLTRRQYIRDDKMEVHLSAILVDAGYSSQTIYDTIRQHDKRAIIFPCHGRGIRAADKPMNLWLKKTGEKVFDNVRLRKTEGRQPILHALLDTNFYKSFVMRRLATELGDSGSLSLFKGSQDEHRLFADHIAAERPVTTTASGRTIDEWKLLTSKPDNHFFDSLVYATAAATVVGCSLNIEGKKHKVIRRRRQVNYLDI